MGFGKDGKGVLIRDENLITLGTLGTKTAIKQGTPLPITQDFRMLKQRHWWSLLGATFVDDDGPLLLGIVNDKLTVAQISEAIDAGGPLDRSDRVPEERAMRSVHLFEEMPIKFSQAEDGHPTEGFIEDKYRWTYSAQDGWAIFAFNMGGGALTTGGIIRLTSMYFGVWVT